MIVTYADGASSEQAHDGALNGDSAQTYPISHSRSILRRTVAVVASGMAKLVS
jgi:hypothetical protein